jgi:exosortase A
MNNESNNVVPKGTGIHLKPDLLHFACFVGMLLLLVACYWETIGWMWDRYLSPDSYYSHGSLVPLVSAYFIWKQRKQILDEPAELCWWGLVMIAVSVLMQVAGTVLYAFSLSGFSLFVMILGGTLFLLGKRITRWIIFPLVFLVFMFPIPEAMISLVSFPLKMIVAKLGVNIVSLFGVPVYREGFQIKIPAGDLVVGNPCSGLRSIIAFLAISSIFAYLIHSTGFRKGMIFLSAIPIALISNMVRVPILILISDRWGLEAAKPGTFWHDASGIFVFALGFIMIFLFGDLLECKRSNKGT